MEKLTAGKILGHSVLLKKIEAESQRKSLRPKSLSYNKNLMQRLDADFLEKDDVVVAVILEADVALVGASAPLRFEIEFALGNGLALGVVGDVYIVQEDHGVGAVQCDDHSVPFGAGLAVFGEL